MHTLARFCESRRRFSLFSPLNIYISLFYLCLPDLSLLPALSLCSLPAAVFPSSTLQAQGHPCPSLLPPFLPSLRLSSVAAVCSVAAVPFALSPSLPLSPSGAPPKLSGGLLCVVPCVVCCPSLVHRQAQNAMTVWAEAPRICPRPCLLLPMCCRYPFRGFLPCVRVCVLLPCVVWW